ncbi:MAG: molybdate ABC transporter permease subunit [Nautiliaceae bacterium]
MIDFTPLILSFKVAFLTTFILFFVSLPIAYFLAFTKSKFKPFLETIFSLPMVLPSTVLGFYLLILFSDKYLGGFLKKFNAELLFSFEGVVVASCIYSFPFMLGPIQSAIEQVNKSLLEVSYTLGKSKIETFFRVILPNIKRSIIVAVILTFAHTIGEFGVVLIIGGSIPGVTEVASIAIYNYIENLNYHSAFVYSAILLAFSFCVLLILNILSKGFNDKS